MFETPTGNPAAGGCNLERSGCYIPKFNFGNNLPNIFPIEDGVPGEEKCLEPPQAIRQLEVAT